MSLLLADYPGMDGFLGTRGSLMLDVVFSAMFAVVPLMAASVFLARYRQRYQWHKTMQLALALVLLVAVAAFEIDMRVTGWVERAQPSPFWQDGKWNDPVDGALAVHLFFAVPTFFLWVFVIVQAWRKFPVPPAPNAYSPRHLVWARLAAFEMLMTAITGWVFYWLAFGAK